MFIKMFKELTKDIQKQLNEFQESSDIKLEKTQKQLNELKEDINKHWNETKKIWKKR
jgi:uncharacterized membrane-anchored protein YhcB (DUF1043 family)